MHAVDGANERRLAAARWADERSHTLRSHRQRDILDGSECTVAGRDVVECQATTITLAS